MSFTSEQRYETRGVSSKKEDVHQALENVDKGLFPNAFCKIVPDTFSQDPNYCVAMHADGSGTKSSLAYLYYQETQDLSVFQGIAQDAIVMNTDDLLCIGACGPMLLSSTIGRNRQKISGEVLKALIEGHEKVAQQFQSWGIPLQTTGGETADLGDLVRTLIVDTTVITRMKRSEVISNEAIEPGDFIIGLSSTGQTTYESQYNSGMGSNGLTSARHDLLHYSYAQKYPESYDPSVPENLVYTGPYQLTDALEGTSLNIGQALLSPTRTYAPIIKELLDDPEHHQWLHGMVHCSGGGQTKCLRFGEGIRYIKHHLFETPPLFQTIQKASGTPWKEMYQVFNMGHRMELIGSAMLWEKLQPIAQKYELDIQKVGVCEKAGSSENELLIASEHGQFEYRL